MIIKNIEDSDRDRVLDFCQDTFSWGDYIDLVWQHWILEGNFLGAYSDKNTPVGICHASISEPAKQVWVEGIRVNPKHRRKKIAQNLVLESESVGIKHNCRHSYMLIENTNHDSLSLAQKLHYAIEGTWNFYSVQNSSGKAEADAFFVTSHDSLLGAVPNSRFVKSWRWLPFNEIFIAGLVASRQMVCAESDGVKSIATLIPSEHFDNTVLATLLCGNQKGINEIIKLIQNNALENNVSRIQLLADERLLSLQNDSAARRLTFHLMKKDLLPPLL